MGVIVISAELFPTRQLVTFEYRVPGYRPCSLNMEALPEAPHGDCAT